MPSLRSFGPAVAHVPPVEAVRAGVGALVAIAMIGLFLLSPGLDLKSGLYLVAPFGATSVLLFAVPNSPLAQPWSAIVGNTVAALIGVGVSILVHDPLLRIALAVSLTITATILCRAVHPPAGAVAMTAALSPDAVDHLGFWFAFAPIGLGTVVLVALAIGYARLTGRQYPLRQFDEPNRHGLREPPPAERLGLNEEDLTGILERYRQSFNLGVEDLARLIGAAEIQAAQHSIGPVTAADIMSRDLITVSPEAPLSEVAELFRRHKFTSLPVVGADAVYMGVIFQIHLIGRGTQRASTHQRFLHPLRELLPGRKPHPVRAGDIMAVHGPRAAPETPVAALLPLMAEGEVDAVPILADEKIVGIVTRTDLIAALARRVARRRVT